MNFILKIIIASTFIITSSVLLSGCGTAEPQPEPGVPGAPEEIISLSISHSHMSRFSAYWFVLKEKDGEILFSGNYFDFDNDYEEIGIDDVPVDSEYMYRLRETVGNFGLVHYKYREPGIIDKMISDAPMDSLSMRWPDGKSLNLNYRTAGTDEVEQIFRELAEALKYNQDKKEEN